MNNAKTQEKLLIALALMLLGAIVLYQSSNAPVDLGTLSNQVVTSSKAQQATKPSGSSFAGSTERTTFSETQGTAFPININTATLSDLMQLDSIGEVKAAAIINYREENGGFSSVDELLDVSGIGEGTFAKIRDYVTV